jgi:hypothetical protein
MKNLGFFISSKGDRYTGNYFPDMKQVEVLGPIDEKGPDKLPLLYIDQANSEEEALATARNIIKLF